MKISDEQIIKILELVAHNPGEDKVYPYDQWEGMDTLVGTTKELLSEARKILEETDKDGD